MASAAENIDAARGDPSQTARKENHLVDNIETKEDDDDIVVVSMQGGDGFGDDLAQAAEPLRRENAVAEIDKNGDFAGAGDLVTRDNTGDMTGRKSANSVASESPVRRENPEDMSGKTETAYGSGDKTVESKKDAEDEWEDILGNSLLKKKVTTGNLCNMVLSYNMFSLKFKVHAADKIFSNFC